MSVTFGASANATPASGTIIATCVVDSEHYQLMIPAGTDGAPIGGGPTTPLYVSACVVNLAGSALGSPQFVSVTNQAGSAAGSPLFVTPTNIPGSALGAPIFSSLTNVGGSAIGSPFFVAEVRSAGSAAGSPLFVSACITNLAGSAAGSPLFVTPTNIPGSALGTPIFSSLTNIGGSAIGSPFFVAEVRSAGSAAGSPLFASITNLAGSAAGSPLFVTPTNIPGSALGTPIFSSLTNIGGSAIGSPFFVAEVRAAGSAAGSPLFSSITNLAGSAAGSPLFTRVGDGADTAFVDAASRLAVALTDGTNAFGLAGSPLPVVEVINQMYYAGSLLTVNLVDISASAAGCTLIVASTTGIAIVVVGATYTTSSCQRIGWTACGNDGGASAVVQTPMPFGTNGGMTETDLLWQFPSGSKAMMTTTSACVVAGRLKYLSVAS